MSRIDGTNLSSALWLNPRPLGVNARLLGVDLRSLGTNPRETAPRKVEELQHLQAQLKETVDSYKASLTL